MLLIDDEEAWHAYVKVNSDAKQYRWKVIPNWDDIVDLCSKDRATGEGAKTAADAADNMISIDENFNIDEEIEDNGNSTSVRSQKRKSMSISDVPSSKRRGGSSGTLVSAVSDMASPFREYVQCSNQKVDIDEVYDEVSMVHDLDEDQKLKAYAWFLENEQQFKMLKKLPMDMKRKWILMFLSK